MTAKKIPYKDTYLTFYNYKEPLRFASTGFGYQGVLLGSIDGEQIQCHLCGELHKDLGPHIRSKHSDTAKDSRGYKEMFGLALETALISENERNRRKLVTMKWWASMSAQERTAFISKQRKAINKWFKENGAKKPQPKQSLETKNKRGTCPDQLLDKIAKCAEDIGKTPTKAEFMEWDGGSQRYVHLVYATFGSWKDACRMVGLREHKPVQNGGRNNNHSDEELLDALTIFHQENGRIPSYTDSRRKLIPDANIYIRRFGSFSKARKLAGITERPTRWGNVPA